MLCCLNLSFSLIRFPHNINRNIEVISVCVLVRHLLLERYIWFNLNQSNNVFVRCIFIFFRTIFSAMAGIRLILLMSLLLVAVSKGNVINLEVFEGISM